MNDDNKTRVFKFLDKCKEDGVVPTQKDIVDNAGVSFSIVKSCIKEWEELQRQKILEENIKYSESIIDESFVKNLENTLETIRAAVAKSTRQSISRLSEDFKKKRAELEERELEMEIRIKSSEEKATMLAVELGSQKEKLNQSEAEKLSLTNEKAKLLLEKVELLAHKEQLQNENLELKQRIRDLEQQLLAEKK